MTARVAGLILVALLTASCGTRLMRLPTDPGVRADDARDALTESMAGCRRVRTLTAEVNLKGSLAGRRVRARLEAGVAAPASARLEAMASFGPPLFIFTTTGQDAAVLLPRDRRFLDHEHPRAVLEAIAGVPLDAADLRTVLTGCVLEEDEITAGRAVGDAWRVVPFRTDLEAYLHRERSTGPWRVVAVVRRGAPGARAWRAEFAAFASDLPRQIRVVSASGVPRDQSFDLELSLSQVNANVPLAADVFRLRAPAETEPMTLDELRSAGPLAVYGGGAPDGS